MKNRIPFVVLALGGLGFSVVLASQGCDKDDPPVPDDKQDMSAKLPDLSHNHSGDMATGSPDLATSGDMAMAAADMAGGGPKVTGLPSCTDRGVTADMVFSSVAKASCANGRCHSTGAAGLTFTDGATLKSGTVGKKSSQAAMLDIVKAGSVDGSYLIYKLMNQHMAPGVGGRGELMPKGGTKLPDADLCKFIVWVQEGAK